MLSTNIDLGLNCRAFDVFNGVRHVTQATYKVTERARVKSVQGLLQGLGLLECSRVNVQFRVKILPLTPRVCSSEHKRRPGRFLLYIAHSKCTNLHGTTVNTALENKWLGTKTTSS